MLETIKKGAARVWGRKTFITLVCLGLGTLVDIYAANGLSANLMSLMGMLAGAFVVGNSVENHAASKVTQAQIKAGSESPKDDRRIDGVENQVSIANQGIATIMDTLSYIIKASGLDNPDQYQKEVKTEVDSNASKRQAAAKVING